MDSIQVHFPNHLPSHAEVVLDQRGYRDANDEEDDANQVADYPDPAPVPSVTDHAAHELWTKTSRPRGRHARDPHAEYIRYDCNGLDDLETDLRDYLEAPTVPAEHATIEFHFPSTAAFMVYTRDFKRNAATNWSGVEVTDLVRKTAVSVGQVLQQTDQPKDQIVRQKAVARTIVEAVQRADKYRYSFHNNWLSREDQAHRFSFFCNDSTLNKGRAANGGAGTEGRVLRKPAYDCKGLIAIKFSVTKDNLEVHYRHVPLHKSFDERAPLPRKESKRYRMMEVLDPEALTNLRDERRRKLQADREASSWTKKPYKERMRKDKDNIRIWNGPSRSEDRQIVDTDDPAITGEGLQPLVDFLGSAERTSSNNVRSNGDDEDEDVDDSGLMMIAFDGTADSSVKKGQSRARVSLHGNSGQVPNGTPRRRRARNEGPQFPGMMEGSLQSGSMNWNFITPAKLDDAQTVSDDNRQSFEEQQKRKQTEQSMRGGEGEPKRRKQGQETELGLLKRRLHETEQRLMRIEAEKELNRAPPQPQPPHVYTHHPYPYPPPQCLYYPLPPYGYPIPPLAQPQVEVPVSAPSQQHPSSSESVAQSSHDQQREERNQEMTGQETASTLTWLQPGQTSTRARSAKTSTPRQAKRQDRTRGPNDEGGDVREEHRNDKTTAIIDPDVHILSPTYQDTPESTRVTEPTVQSQPTPSGSTQTSTQIPSQRPSSPLKDVTPMTFPEAVRALTRLGAKARSRTLSLNQDLHPQRSSVPAGVTRTGFRPSSQQPTGGILKLVDAMVPVGYVGDQRHSTDHDANLKGLFDSALAAMAGPDSAAASSQDPTVTRVPPPAPDPNLTPVLNHTSKAPSASPTVQPAAVPVRDLSSKDTLPKGSSTWQVPNYQSSVPPLPVAARQAHDPKPTSTAAPARQAPPSMAPNSQQQYNYQYAYPPQQPYPPPPPYGYPPPTYLPHPPPAHPSGQHPPTYQGYQSYPYPYPPPPPGYGYPPPHMYPLYPSYPYQPAPPVHPTGPKSQKKPRKKPQKERAKETTQQQGASAWSTQLREAIEEFAGDVPGPDPSLVEGRTAVSGTSPGMGTGKATPHEPVLVDEDEMTQGESDTTGSDRNKDNTGLRHERDNRLVGSDGAVAGQPAANVVVSYTVTQKEVDTDTNSE